MVEEKKDGFVVDAARMQETINGTSGAAVLSATHAGYTSGRDILPNISVREPFTRYNFNIFRPDGFSPTNPQKAICECVELSNNGIVNQVFSLMSDFVCKGIRFSHPTTRYDNFLQDWAIRTEAKYKSERMVDTLLRYGNLLVWRTNGKIPTKTKNAMYLTADNQPNNFEEQSVPKNEIPMKYTIINPLGVENVTSDLAQFSDKNLYKMAIPKISMKYKETTHYQNFYNNLPQEYKDAFDNNKTEILLNPDRLRTMFYKKPDWMAWALPITYAIKEDLKRLNRLKLADDAALDGVISKIRLWKIGNIDKGIMPTQAAVDNFKEMLLANTGGGVFDIIYNPAIDLIETKTDTFNFLGGDKYRPVLTEIYAGLGIPPILTGDGGGSGGSGFNNTFFSLKIFIERLLYLRERLIEFWQYELKLLAKALGWNKYPVIEFDNMIAHDEAVEKQILIDLRDRGVITDETLRERVGENNTLEIARIKREQARIDKGTMPTRVGPYYTDTEGRLKEIFSQRGVVTPSEVGLELDERNSKQNEMLDKNQPKNKAAALGAGGVAPANKKKPSAKNGRPKGKTDTTGRKQRMDKPKTQVASLQLYTIKSQKLISEIVSDEYLRIKGKKNLRQLSAEEVEDLESAKFAVLFSCEPFEKLDKDKVLNVLANLPPVHHDDVDDYKACIETYRETFKSEPTLEDLRNIQISVYVDSRGNNG